MSVSSSSSYGSNPSTNLSTIAGATPGKLPQSQQTAVNSTLHAQHKPAGPTGTTTTTTHAVNDPHTTVSSTTTKGVPVTSTAASTAGATAPVAHTQSTTTRVSSPPVNPPIFHGDSSTPLVVTKTATAIPSTPLILTPELNETLTNAYVPTHSDNSWMKDLAARMEAARLEIDHRAQEEQKHINDDATRRVNALLQEHKHQQDALIASSHARGAEIDREYSKKKEAALLALETENNRLREALEQDLVSQQQRLANDVRQKATAIAEEAKQQKLKVIEDAQRKEKMLGASAANSIAAHDAATATGNH